MQIGYLTCLTKYKIESLATNKELGRPPCTQHL